VYTLKGGKDRSCSNHSCAKTGIKSRNVLPGPGSDTGETPAVANTCRAGVYLISATFQLVCAHGIGVHE
jgi:hypothetical protein